MDDEQRFLKNLERRTFLRRAAAGTIVVAFGGGLYWLARDEVTEAARRQKLPDGRPRLPDGQRVLSALRPMGGEPGNPSPGKFRLRVHGDVKRPLELDYEALKVGAAEERADVHCVTGWSVLDAKWKGLRLVDLAERAGVRDSARFVIFEAAWGYTANLPLANALEPNVLVAYRLDDKPLSRAHGAPVRAVVPGLYFWKSAKYLTGIRFSKTDSPGYWEVRGYHNRGDPWLEERYA